MDIEDLFVVLRRLPKLRTLVLRLVFNTDTDFDDDYPPIELPDLEDISICGPPSEIESIMDCLSMPQNINIHVDIRLRATRNGAPREALDESVLPVLMPMLHHHLRLAKARGLAFRRLHTNYDDTYGHFVDIIASDPSPVGAAGLPAQVRLSMRRWGDAFVHDDIFTLIACIPGLDFRQMTLITAVGRVIPWVAPEQQQISQTSSIIS